MTKPPAAHEDMRRVATSVVRRLRGAGHEAWFVGGCVREMLLGMEPQDFDVTTDATPDRLVELFPHTVEVGARFGVVTVIEDGVHVEVATFRTEGSYSDGRRPDTVAYSSAREDVERRDFTVNALLYDPIEGRVVDHVGGRADLAAGVLRTVGDPATRFAEDHLRLLRAVRFTARLGFRLDEAARAAVVALAPRITLISPERVRDELSRMLLHPSRASAFRLLDELGLLPHVLPEIHALHGVEQPSEYHPEGDVFVHTMLALEALPDAVGEDVAWGLLLHDIGKPATFSRDADGRIRFFGHDALGARMATDVLTRLRASNALRDRVSDLVARHLHLREVPHMKKSTLRRLVALPWIDDLVTLCRADALAGSGDLSHLESLERRREELGQEATLPPPFVTGRDLVEAGVPQGPERARLLARLMDLQLEGELTSREEALARLRELL